MDINERNTFSLLDPEEVWKMQKGIVFVNRLTLMQKLTLLDGCASHPSKEGKRKADKIRNILSRNAQKYIPMDCIEVQELLDKENLSLISLRRAPLSNDD